MEAFDLKTNTKARGYNETFRFAWHRKEKRSLSLSLQFLPREFFDGAHHDRNVRVYASIGHILI